MSNKGVLPEDIIADGADYTLINGTTVRKGSVGAFIANIDILQNPDSSPGAKQKAIEAMQQLAPVLVGAGLHRHVNFKNKLVEEIMQQAAKNRAEV